MKNSFIFLVLTLFIFSNSSYIAEAKILTEDQKLSVIELLEKYSASPDIIKSISKIIGYIGKSVVGPTIIIKDAEAKSIATSTSENVGEYTLTLEVTAGSKSISIPLSTTDSTQGQTGFVYSLGGQEFRGLQTSTVKCGSSLTKSCKIGIGQTKMIKVTVRLNPTESGNYGISFEKLNYILSGETQTYRINKETEVIYIK